MTSLDLVALSRKELQVLAKEFQLCRGNAKSDVILQHVQEFVAANPSDGETRVRNALGSASDSGAAPATPKKVSKPEPVVAKKKASPVAAAVASPVVTKVSPKMKAEKTVTPRKEDTTGTPKPESAKKTPEEKAAHKSPAKSEVATEDAKKQKKTPEKKTVTSSPVVSAKKAAKAEATLPSATKQTPPKNAPVKKSPAKENPRLVAEKELTPKSKRPALASLDANVVKTKKAKKSEKVTVDSLVSSIGDLAFAGDGSKVRCTTTGHEMKAEVDVITTYIQGKSYQRAQLKKQSFAAYAPMFTAHSDEKKVHLLWCHVTETEHPREVARVKAHMAGPRYQKELPRWQEVEAARIAGEKEAAAKAAAKAKARAEKLKQLEKAANGETSSDFSSKKRKRRSSSKKSKQTTEEVETSVEETKKQLVEETNEEAKRPAKRSRKRKSAQK